VAFSIASYFVCWNNNIKVLIELMEIVASKKKFFYEMSFLVKTLG